MNEPRNWNEASCHYLIFALNWLKFAEYLPLLADRVRWQTYSTPSVSTIDWNALSAECPFPLELHLDQKLIRIELHLRIENVKTYTWAP